MPELPDPPPVNDLATWIAIVSVLGGLALFGYLIKWGIPALVRAIGGLGDKLEQSQTAEREARAELRREMFSWYREEIKARETAHQAALDKIVSAQQQATQILLEEIRRGR